MLQSELIRLKSRLAADAGDEDLLTFLYRESVDDITYVEDLRTRLA